jgi:hypothetical protein
VNDPNFEVEGPFDGSDIRVAMESQQSDISANLLQRFKSDSVD